MSEGYIEVGTYSENGNFEETAETETEETINMATKMYKAFVKSKETGELTIIESEYTSKKDFARDLRANGYAVKFISTPEKFDEDCENYHWELKRRKNIREAMKQHKASKEQEVY